MADRMTRVVYVPPLRVDITVRENVPRIVPLARLARAVRAAAVAAGAPTPTSVGLVLTDDAELARLNRRHLGKRGPTDVLSFPLLLAESFGRTTARPASADDGDRSIGAGPPRSATGQFVLPPGARVSLGDIAVSVERAIAQAREGRGGQDGRTAWDARDELLLLVVHGTLHLCGWDHAEPAEGEAMRAIERRLLAEVVRIRTSHE